MDYPSTCHECGKRALYSSERADVCKACGYYYYYRDAYAPGDTNSTGFHNENITDEWR